MKPSTAIPFSREAPLLGQTSQAASADGETTTPFLFKIDWSADNNYQLVNQLVSDSATNGADATAFTTAEKVVFSMTLIVMIVIGLIGNGLTISAVMCRRFRLRTPANYFVLNLAMADFSISVISNSTHLANIWSSFMQHSSIVCRFLATLCILTCSESLFTLAAIAVFRFLGVRTSLQDLAKRRRLAFTLIGITWLMSLAFSLGNLVSEADDLYTPDAMMCLYKFRETGMAVLTLLLIVASLVVVTGTYVSLVVRLVANENEQKRVFESMDDGVFAAPASKKDSLSSGTGHLFLPQMTTTGGRLQRLIPVRLSASKRRLLSVASTASFPHLLPPPWRKNASSCTSSSYNRLNLSKTIKTVFFLVALIYIFWIPTFVIQGLARSNIQVPYPLSMVALLLSHANSSINFIIYAVFNKVFRRALVNFVLLLFPCCSPFLRRAPLNIKQPNAAGKSFKSRSAVADDECRRLVRHLRQYRLHAHPGLAADGKEALRPFNRCLSSNLADPQKCTHAVVRL